MCAFIFFMSAQPADESSALSMGVVNRIIALVVPGYEQMGLESQLYWQDSLEHVVRKLAHFSEYAVLGALAANLARQIAAARRAAGTPSTNGASARNGRQGPQALGGASPNDAGSMPRPLRIIRTALVPWAASALYAATDEFHQMFVPGRACLATDVLIDSAGAAVGIALLLAIACAIEKRAERKR